MRWYASACCRARWIRVTAPWAAASGPGEIWASSRGGREIPASAAVVATSSATARRRVSETTDYQSQVAPTATTTATWTRTAVRARIANGR